MILRLFCWMLLACLKCDFQPNGIFNLLKIHTYIHVISHFQGMSFYFRVNKKVEILKNNLVLPIEEALFLSSNNREASRSIGKNLL